MSGTTHPDTRKQILAGAPAARASLADRLPANRATNVSPTGKQRTPPPTHRDHLPTATPQAPAQAQTPTPAPAPAAESEWWNLYASERPHRTGDDLHSDGRELSRREPTASESTGRRTLLRAAFTASVGGGVISLVSLAFGPRFFASDVRLLGILVGLAIVALGIVAPIGSEHRKTTSGALIIVCAILAFPIAAGGYFIGSIVSIIGGALLVAYEPPPDDVTIIVNRSGRVRRFTGLVVDFVMAFALHRMLFALLPEFFESTLNVITAWAFSWIVVAVVPSLVTRRTGGRILLVERLVDAETAERSNPTATLIRELLRGIVAIGGFVTIVRVVLGTEIRLLPGLIAVVAVMAVGLVAERLHLLDRLTGTVSVYDAVVPSENVDGEAEVEDRQSISQRIATMLPGRGKHPSAVSGR